MSSVEKPAGGPGEGIEIELLIEDEGWADPQWGDPLALVRRAVAAVAARLPALSSATSELSLVLADDATVKALNAQWRDKDKATNVLSFPAVELQPGDAPGPLLGDIIVARETVLAEASAEQKAPADHFCHLVVHGLLHLLGYDHIEEAEAEEMEALEVAVLGDLGIADPYEAGDGAHID
ncbi:rRNA maturation RNase YbeY [Consotaella salsifontis]|uniref:Endoribonuclease YbeY n=1 Tax=Consotaella salsifontis TaxID=1365950 RepID=A0A1T4S5F6_9HYPH|nr:rRNA maturation RNase YbeY [Consotaella salsifontis]SKA23530.1 probable rRNA maturation factor [Consotaella salsifontis]